MAVQIISNLYHNFPEQRTLIVTHSNQVLDRHCDTLCSPDSKLSIQHKLGFPNSQHLPEIVVTFELKLFICIYFLDMDAFIVQALNQLFEKIMALDIDERHLLRMGHGEEELETEKDFSRCTHTHTLNSCVGQISFDLL